MNMDLLSFMRQKYSTVFGLLLFPTLGTCNPTVIGKKWFSQNRPKKEAWMHIWGKMYVILWNLGGQIARPYCLLHTAMIE